jgi:hypothetical protein
VDNDASKELASAAAAPMPTPDKLSGRNAERRLLMTAKPSKPDIPPSHAPLSNPELIPNSELAVTALQDTIAAYADELRRRARQGNITHKDGQLVASLATASAKLAAEQREQTKELHLSLQSDDDIVKLVIDSVLALGKRGTAILTKALAALPTQGNDS